VSGTGQALQGGSITDPAGRVGRSWIYIIFYVFTLKCLILKGFQAESGIFAIFRPKIRAWQTMPLKVRFTPGFREFITECSTNTLGLCWTHNIKN
jgi:hypothetical protein